MNRHTRNRTGICQRCGVEFNNRPHKNCYRARKYCTLNCHTLNKRKGELKNDRHSYQSWRSHIQRNARLVYMRSNKERVCIICKYSNHVEICHIKPVSEFNNEALMSEINSIDNLVALCPNHHWEVDNGVLRLNDIMIKKIAV